MVLYLYTDYAGLYTFHALSNVLQSLLYTFGQFTAVANIARAGRAVLPRGVSIQNSVYTHVPDRFT